MRHNANHNRILLTSTFTALLFGLAAMPISAADVPAFPGAEGYGSVTRGGRGGKVMPVTNLNPSGPGSLQAACDAEGPRIVVFKVAGTIDGDVNSKKDHITIAGQTAPGDGVTIKGNLGIDANEVAIRYLRVRTDHEGDALGGRYRKNIILDHVSASWSSDEVLSLYHNENATIQWCMITEACAKADGSHRFGGIWGNQHGTYHHNLIAHNDSRNIRWASGCGYNDYRNNVLYNWGYESSIWLSSTMPVVRCPGVIRLMPESLKRFAMAPQPMAATASSPLRMTWAAGQSWKSRRRHRIRTTTAFLMSGNYGSSSTRMTLRMLRRTMTKTVTPMWRSILTAPTRMCLWTTPSPRTTSTP